MTEQVLVRNVQELECYKEIITKNLQKSIEAMKMIIGKCSALEAFQSFKFDKLAVEPLTGNAENLIEVINQSQTYLISIMAVEYLYKIYPEHCFRINWGNIPGYDIESVDGKIIAECFAATSYKSNGKLSADLKRLQNNNTACYKYEFFYDREFTDNHKGYYQEKYPEIQIVKIQNFLDI